ncbi:MAG TPA: bifunctional methylenetetrahydrofolate dehydrogenase/methenyltetrahydrofolate cyclohydrolase FolD [Acidiferrobacteraceae bacterium]|nr:bifunctional methylenetetrahydrofolate dehydrogenase/methenyltetrahydrofolate cyclohydrolase FolD [Acidiferrobacteraceae bacterium]
MSAKIIDGKRLAAHLADSIKSEVLQWVTDGHRAPGLAVVIVGDDPASQVYVSKKIKMCEQVGISSSLHRFPAQLDQQELIGLIDQLNQDPKIDGILVQLPLPGAINEEQVTEHIDPSKDVDGLHPYNLGRLAAQSPLLRPCTPRGVMTLLESIDIALVGAHAVVVGASNLVGRPMALELLQARCTVTICHSRTQNLPQQVEQADILVVAVGKAGLIKGEWIKPGAVVIDVGTNRADGGRLVGDVEFDTARHRAAWITPVPGGVGPMTVITLMQNTLQAARNP